MNGYIVLDMARGTWCAKLHPSLGTLNGIGVKQIALQCIRKGRFTLLLISWRLKPHMSRRKLKVKPRRRGKRRTKPQSKNILNVWAIRLAGKRAGKNKLGSGLTCGWVRWAAVGMAHPARYVS